MQEGFVAIPNHLLDALLAADLPGRQFKLAMAVIRKTIGYGKDSDDCTIQQLADVAGIHRPDASKAIQALLDAKIVTAKKGQHGLVIAMNDPENWQISDAKSTTTNVAKRYEQNTTNVAKRYGERSETLHTIDNPNRQDTYSSSLRSDELGTQAENQPAKPGKVKLNPQRLIDLYHEHCQTLPAVKLLTESRKLALRQRWQQAAKDLKRYPVGDIDAGLAWWSKFFSAVDASDFLSGRDGRWSSCNLDWLLKQANFAKVIEGNYSNGRGQQ